MKKILLFCFLIGINFGYTQIISIPDTNFKTQLVSANSNNQVARDANYDWMTIDANNDGEIQVSEAQNVAYLYLTDRGISSTQGINEFVNLLYLDLSYNSISTIDISAVLEIGYLNVSGNNLTYINLSNNISLTELNIADNNLNEELVLSANPFLNILNCQNNTDLVYLNLKNGNNNNFLLDNTSNFSNIQNNVSVCVDELNSDLTNYINSQTTNAVFTEYCSLSPAQHNEITGIIHLDSNNNDCDNGDFAVPNKMVITNNGTEQFATFTQQDGTYKIYTNQGDFTTSLSANLPPYNSLTPTSYSHNFASFNELFTADFCLIPNQNQHDVEVSILPLNNARPGIIAKYQLIYTNNGNTTISGDIQFNFDDSKLSFQNANPAPSLENSDSLTFDYSNLFPFETRTITVEFVVSAPPTVVLDDVLDFTVNITPIADDYSPNNNTFNYKQTVVDSHDPNDIHILEGSQISFSQKNNFLHYALRFQNTGSASAYNVVVKNILDDKLDWSTMELQNTSHPCRVVISNGNKIEFIFENIQLASADTNEENSHGFIAYKIKPISTVQVDELIPNQADIFFDLNEAMPTNVANTKFVNTLAVANKNLLEFNIYPIPSNSVLNVNSAFKISQIEIYSSLGQLILKNNNKKNITISSLEKGLYFCKVTAVSGSVGMKKWMKN